MKKRKLIAALSLSFLLTLELILLPTANADRQAPVILRFADSLGYGELQLSEGGDDSILSNTLLSHLRRFRESELRTGIDDSVRSPLLVAQGEDSGQSGRVPPDTEALVKKAQSPIADLISVSLELNRNKGIGPNHRPQNVLNIEPVIPFHLNDDWNLITRWIIPVIQQPDLEKSDRGTWGLGDLNPSFFVTPRSTGNLSWGLGPTFLLNTATSDKTGTGKWSIGPTGAVVWSTDHWVTGALANNIWSFGGDSERANINQFRAQYFINYNLPDGWYLTSSPTITADWKRPSDERWLVPLGGGLGWIFPIGKQKIIAEVQYFRTVVHPDTDPFPDWTVRVQMKFLFP